MSCADFERQEKWFSRIATAFIAAIPLSGGIAYFADLSAGATMIAILWPLVPLIIAGQYFLRRCAA